jgi:hypothetical protein
VLGIILDDSPIGRTPPKENLESLVLTVFLLSKSRQSYHHGFGRWNAKPEQERPKFAGCSSPAISGIPTAETTTKK